MTRGIRKRNTVRETVLIVDDDPEWIEHLCHVVGRKYQIITTCGGEEALRLASNTDTKVIILDVMMAGGCDGFTILKALKSSSKTKNIPVIMYSEVNQVENLQFSPEVIQKYLNEAPFAFLEKPSTPAKLMKTIASAMESVRKK